MSGAQKPRPFILRRRREPKKNFSEKKIRPTGRPASAQICELVDLGLSGGLKLAVAVPTYRVWKVVPAISTEGVLRAPRSSCL
jgi:hypothetical protein